MISTSPVKASATASTNFTELVLDFVKFVESVASLWLRPKGCVVPHAYRIGGSALIPMPLQFFLQANSSWPERRLHFIPMPMLIGLINMGVPLPAAS
jgi:hypothetical protein